MSEKFCPRCGTQLAAASSDLEAGVLLPRPEGWETRDGLVCLDCVTAEEKRTEEMQCARCGAQFHDDGRDSDAGWIVSSQPGEPFICPPCQTPEEDAAQVAALAEAVERGELLTAAKGEEYPARLAALAQHERARVERQQEAVDDLDRQLGGERR